MNTRSLRAFRIISRLRALPPQNVLKLTAFKGLRRPLSVLRRPPQRPPPTYSRFPLDQPGSLPHGGRSHPNYSRFPRVAELQLLWRTNSAFRIGVVVIAVGGGVFYVINLERVPITGRLRFNCIPESWEVTMGEQVTQQILHQYKSQILPASHPSTRMAQRVLERLLPVSGIGEGSWNIAVIDDPNMLNAFVVPG